MLMRQKLRRISIFATLSLLLFTVFAGTLPQTASALGAGSDIVDSVETEVKNRQKYYWLRNCFYHSDIDRVTPTEMETWDFFEGAGAGDMSEIIGGVYGPGKLATWGCKAEINVERAFNALGVTNPREAFCKIDGALYNKSNNNNSCLGGAIPNAEWDNNLDSGDKQGAAFERAAAAWAPDVVKPITDVQNYVRYYISFIYECNITLKSGVYTEGEADPDDAYQVPIITTGSDVIQDRLGLGLPYKNSQVAIVATKTGDAYTKGDVASGSLIQVPRGEVVNCNEAVEKLRQYAPAYLKYVNDNPDAIVSQLDDVSENGPEATCESLSGILSYVVCPVLAMLDGGIYLLTVGIESLLSVDADKYNNPNLVQGWQTMRNIALLILIPMMLLMVIGTALEFGPFDAYTVKKSLPRMLVAVIFITLSLPITQFLVNLSNVVGYGIQNLVLAASNSPESLLDLYGPSEGLLFSGLVTGGLVTASLLPFITWGVVGSLALVTFVSLFIGYIILVVRQLLILMLMMVAPLAILVWIFPGNDKLWKIWKTTFTALLMMFPLIMLLIASGKVFAGIVGSTESSFTAFFFKIIALVAPFFFIPATFKYGLGVFGNIAGIVNDRSRGFFDKQRKSREGSRSKAWTEARQGNRFRGGTDNNLRGKFNRRLAQGLNAPGAIMEQGALFKPRNWGTAGTNATRARQDAERERALKENLGLQTWIGNDTAMGIAGESRNETDLRTRLAAETDEHGRNMFQGQALDDAVSQIETFRRQVSPETFARVTHDAANAGGTYWKNKSAGRALASIARASGADSSIAANMVASTRRDAMKAGRYEIGGNTFGSTLSYVDEMRQELAETGNISEETIARVDAQHKAEVFQNQSGALMGHASVKPQAIEEMTDTMVNSVENARALGDERSFVQSIAAIEAIHKGQAGSSPKRAKIMADKVISHELNVSELSDSMRSRLKSAIEVPDLDADGNPQYEQNNDGRPVMKMKERDKITLVQASEALTGDKEYREMGYQYSKEIESAAAQLPLDPSAAAGGALPPGVT